MKKENANNPYKKDFDFLKLFTVVIFLGVVFSGIIVIRNVNKEYEIRQVAGNFQQYKYAILSFNNIYSGLPGDINNATFFWKDETKDGDGDRVISENGDEGILAWQHLQLAGLITLPDNEKMSGKWKQGSENLIIPKYNVPSGKIDNSGYFFKYNEDASANSINYAVCDNKTSLPSKPAMTPEETYMLDLMIDDGYPDTGNVIGRGDGSDKCGLGGEYKKEDEILECVIKINI